MGSSVQKVRASFVIGMLKVLPSKAPSSLPKAWLFCCTGAVSEIISKKCWWGSGGSQLAQRHIKKACLQQLK